MFACHQCSTCGSAEFYVSPSSLHSDHGSLSPDGSPACVTHITSQTHPPVFICNTHDDSVPEVVPSGALLDNILFTPSKVVAAMERIKFNRFKDLSVYINSNFKFKTCIFYIVYKSFSRSNLIYTCYMSFDVYMVIICL